MAVPIVMPKLGMVMSEGVVARWAKAAGETVRRGEVIAEIETEKINYDLEAAEDGILHPVVDEGASVLVDGVVAYLLAEGEEVPEAPPEPPAPTASAPPSPPRRARAAQRPAGGEVRSTPGARRLASQLGVDIGALTPTGPGGRVVEADVRAHSEQKIEAAGPAVPPVPPGLPEPARTVAIGGIRKSIGDHMRRSIADTAQLSFSLEVDVTDAQEMRKEASRGGVTIALAHVLTKACAVALGRQPELNSVLGGGNILYFDQVNIGVAVALKEGLIVPVVRDVAAKSLADISRETTELADKARDGKLLPDDTAAGTFTISVLGSVDSFTPILNSGQSAILGVGRSVEKPVVRDGEVVVRQMMTLSLTVDHQVIDGAVAAGFLRRLQQNIERPDALFK
ncbi:MAG: dihydrolipoamide acetyltransferase family protein [Vicinamibacterales bacterium]|nr:dihydrolipoamide acetyltransferase family protein [Vicinamibacterales bacterium]